MATDRSTWTSHQTAWANHAAAIDAAEHARNKLNNAQIDHNETLRDHNPDTEYGATRSDIADSQRALDTATDERDRAEKTLTEATSAFHATQRLTRRQFADLLNISPDTLSGYVNRGQAPPPDGRDQHGHPWWTGTTAHAYADARHNKRPGARTDLNPQHPWSHR